MKAGKIITFPTIITSPVIQTIKRYTLLRWNGHYGAEAQFVVKDNFNSSESMFTPGLCRDLEWLYVDLANVGEMLYWEEFGNESFDDLEEIAF